MSSDIKPGPIHSGPGAKPGTYSDETPAPLDPSKVKAGDTVTLVQGGTSVAGPVENIEEDPETVGFAIGHVGWKYLRKNVVVQQEGVWTLTDHQPAPEPEPVWKPGTVAEATVKGRFGRVRVMRLHETPTDKTHHWVEESGTIPDDSHVTDLRPLVVIDPAAARESLEIGGFDAETILSILLLLRIEE